MNQQSQQIIDKYKNRRTFTPEEAVEFYSAWIELKPTDYRQYQYRADAKFKLGDFVGVLEDFDAALSLNGTEHEGIRVQRAISLSRLKQYGEASGIFRRVDEMLVSAMGYITDSAAYYYERGFVKEKLYDSQGALQDYIKAMKLDPKYAAKCTRTKFVKNLYALIEAYEGAKEKAIRQKKN